MQADDGDCRNSDQDGCQHGDDEPGGASGVFGGGLGDAHGVDEEVRDELEGFHGFSPVTDNVAESDCLGVS